jgi:uncharacterized protein (TIGR02145 family)
MLLEIVKQIVTKNGEQILFDPKRINAFFLDLAKDEPKPIKRAFIECLDHGIVKILKDVAKEERANCRETLAQRLHTEEGRDVELYRNAIDILCEVLFGCVPSLPATLPPPHRQTIDIEFGRLVPTPLQPEPLAPGRRFFAKRRTQPISPLPPQPEDSSFKDPRDGNVYRTVKIGNQVWMAENLNYKTDGSWCYDNDEANGKKYGRLYTWDAAKAACPKEWHLPTRQEWDDLVARLGGRGSAGERLKAKSGWNDHKGQGGNGTDFYGFSALPGGFCDNSDDSFSGAGDYGGWWTAEENSSGHANPRVMSNGGSYVADYFDYYKSGGNSVRCVKDDPNPATIVVSVPKNSTTVLTTNQSGDSSFKDPRDGKVYKTVKIGNQVWMAENLNYKIDGSWCYNNDEANGKKYGRLYTWNAAKVVCPKGWHLPTRQEWDELLAAVGGSSLASKKLKSANGWNNSLFGSSDNGTDDYGFSALPGGIRLSDRFYHVGSMGYWWTAEEYSSSNAYIWFMYTGNDHLNEDGYDKAYGVSVRCVEDCCGGR